MTPHQERGMEESFYSAGAYPSRSSTGSLTPRSQAPQFPSPTYPGGIASDDYDMISFGDLDPPSASNLDNIPLFTPSPSYPVPSSLPPALDVSDFTHSTPPLSLSASDFGISDPYAPLWPTSLTPQPGACPSHYTASLPVAITSDENNAFHYAASSVPVLNPSPSSLALTLEVPDTRHPSSLPPTSITSYTSPHALPNQDIASLAVSTGADTHAPFLPADSFVPVSNPSSSSLYLALGARDTHLPPPSESTFRPSHSSLRPAHQPPASAVSHETPAPGSGPCAHPTQFTSSLPPVHQPPALMDETPAPGSGPHTYPVQSTLSLPAAHQTPAPGSGPRAYPAQFTSSLPPAHQRPALADETPAPGSGPHAYPAQSMSSLPAAHQPPALAVSDETPVPGSGPHAYPPSSLPPADQPSAMSACGMSSYPSENTPMLPHQPTTSSASDDPPGYLAPRPSNADSQPQV